MAEVNQHEILKKMRSIFKGAISLDQPLSEYTSMKIGGTVKFLLSPVDTHDLSNALNLLHLMDIPVSVLGAGTNLLISEQSLPRAVIQLNSDFFKSIKKDNNAVFVGAGVKLSEFINFFLNNGYTGCEFLAGIPGTIGGALAMNAGARELVEHGDGCLHSISELVIKVLVMNRFGDISLRTNNDLEFGYRISNLKENIILGAWFKLYLADKYVIRSRIQEFLYRKKITQQYDLPNAGCVFKNPEGFNLSAGRMIEDCLLKGRCVGDAQVSSLHANFIVNLGNASFDETKSLINIIQHSVYEKFAVWLETELDIWE
ncbi:MAG: UDP-N-acetylenolpyruvoylglucosamine reductase [Candidatus Omnitrophota bacterium]|nr:MAG: UDP-N-acetylenolpyruvoylglucosamine reductase [Candidatus Omnitrophota bacterium]